MLFYLEMLTLDLNKSNANVSVHGKIILNISTNVNVPIRNGTNTLVPGTHNSSLNGSSTSLSRPAATAQASSAAAVTSEQPPQISVPSSSPAAATNNSQSQNNTSSNTNSDDRSDLPAG